ncbi:copper chaperone CopZ [Schinkia azotoformans]|uniref:copper chaperone CopZ n=1 Tax=Schinkia azotoformans TaxID=1454 RepID=UPI002DBEFD9F|nr:copper chaperone CopZ [Schinkia azotoformans]MEC1742810.1 copper chaperone CopZ [Schinkia azotoformans]MEC1769017.1 copper chaperone CopZ [Schinkia azotoformans]MEC1789602.1 copper chaperone CopZ [Schinkia azotoformans]MED4378426.1 copper chaperone CopZ [Schinkia azotoformans]MED4417430.1 copper chaperone CopZ [Schinkia azotoformans]
MEKVLLNVEGMSCGHCKQTIEGALGEIDGVCHATVDLKEKTVEINYDSSKVELIALKEVIEDQGYDVK